MARSKCTPFVALAFMLIQIMDGVIKIDQCLRKKRKDITISTPEIVNLLRMNSLSDCHQKIEEAIRLMEFGSHQNLI